MPAGNDTLTGWMEGRRSLYTFLARLYRAEVDETLLDELARWELSSLVAPELADGYALLNQALDRRNASTLTDLAVEYVSLFLSSNRGEAAFPYESVYTSPERLLMQEARDQVVHAYREAGLDRADGFKEPEDHLALELEFMAFLANQSACAVEEGNDSAAIGSLQRQADFIEHHLLNWVPRFCADVERLTQTDFYRAVAKITAGYLAIEPDLVAESIDQLRK